MAVIDVVHVVERLMAFVVVLGVIKMLAGVQVALRSVKMVRIGAKRK